MELSDALMELRSGYLDGKHRLPLSESCSVYLYDQAMAEVELDKAAMLEVLRLLDACSPGGNFHIWLDGGRLTDDGFVYDYNRRPAEVAAVIGRAILEAKRMEAA
jgi:hypothetical protein